MGETPRELAEAGPVSHVDSRRNATARGGYCSQRLTPLEKPNATPYKASPRKSSEREKTAAATGQ